MSGRPTTSTSRPFTSGDSERPTTGWSDSEPPSTSHGPASYAYPTQYQPHQHGGLYPQEEEDEESDDGDVFAYLPPTTANNEPPPPPVAFPNTHHLSAAQLHNLVAAAGLNSAQSQPPPTLSSIAEHQPPETASSSHELETGPNSYSMRAIPFSPATAQDQVRTATNPSVTLSRSAESREVRVALPSTGHSYSSSYVPASPGGKRVSSEPNTSVMDMGTTVSYKYTDMGVDEEEEDSPYPEVRASVSNTDDPEMPTMTFRMWFTGLFLSLIGTSLNTFFNFRYPSPFLSSLVVLLVAYPLGKFAAFVLPIRSWPLPKFLGGGTFSLNPGPFNVKEHVLIFMMSNMAIAPAYAMNTIVVSELFYELDFGIGFNFVLILATQLTGFGLAGICRRFLVWPASMVWPQNLVACTLLNTLHAEDDVDPGTGTSRYRFFVYVSVGAFFWSFLPSFLFQALSVFSWVCWMAPNNLVVNQLFGTVSGLGMGVLTFDWAQIAWIGSPLMVPWWAQIHVFSGFVFFYWFLLPILYYTNVWHMAYLPMGGSRSYDRFGNPYSIRRIFDQVEHKFNLTAYEEYSALYLPGPYAMVYLLAFTLAPCLLVHTLLYHGQGLLNGIQKIRVEEDDIHAKLMRHYPEVPDGWYGTTCVVFFTMAIIAVEVWPTNMPVWALAISILLPFVYVLPIGFIFAVTGQGLAINLLAEIIPGALLPGRPLPNMIFKAYSVQTLAAAIGFTQDLKLGHYMKVPPRASFLVQGTACLLASMVQVGVKEWLFANVPDMCDPNQKNFLICPHNGVYFTASAIWGLVGPTRQFGKGTLYNTHLYALIVGAILPVPVWLWQRRFPKTRLKYINVPVFINGPTYIPPARGINYSSWFVVGIIFQYFLRRRNFRWWSKFNYIASAALDSGTIISIVVIFLTLQLPFANGGLFLNWWGNTVPGANLDGNPIAYRLLGEGEAFDSAPNGTP